MLKYRGRFRVVYEMDLRTYKPGEASFIPCGIKKGANIYRYDEEQLRVYIPSLIIGKRLLKEHPDLFCLVIDSSCETVLSFKEDKMEGAAPILKAMVRGRNIYPGSKKNMKYQK